MPAGTTTAGWPVRRRRIAGGVLISLAAGLSSLVPAPQAALAAAPGAVSISSGADHSCAIENGAAYCWGDNGFGELGADGNADSSVPIAVDTSGVLAGQTLTQIAAGNAYTCAVASTGASYCWGYNGDGDLGDQSFNNSGSPVAVDAGSVQFTQITAGYEDTCALGSTGAAYCWGDGVDGELGDGFTGLANTPVPVDASGVLAGQTLTQITIGQGYACALDSAGAAYCWGANGDGQLGDGSATGSDLPVAVDTSGVLAGKTLTQIAAGHGDSTCALDSAGAAYCWGANGSGELGDGSATGSDVPVAVETSGALAGQTLTQITAGWQHTCALDGAGAAYCWGWNITGNLATTPLPPVAPCQC
jgi:alpha-tubulin suppressor-like RCC1 family protein